MHYGTNKGMIMAWVIIAGILGLSTTAVLIMLRRAPTLPDDDNAGFSDEQRSEYKRMRESEDRPD